MSTDWHLLTKAFLHDPPDKVLDIKGYETRAASYSEAALGHVVSLHDLQLDEYILASFQESLPTLSRGQETQLVVGPEDDKIVVRHPLSGQIIRLESPGLQQREVRTVIKEIVAREDDARKKFLSLWAFLPDRLGWLHRSYSRLPADAIAPDHTIFNHLDTTVGLATTKGDGAFLSFSLGPVQGFVAAARSLRDLWTGSALLSWLTFKAMTPILDNLGPASIVFPSLRGAPLFIKYLIKAGITVDGYEPEGLIPSMPNRFLALVPSSEGEGLAAACEQSARDSWSQLASLVKGILKKKWDDSFPGWDERWQEQVQTYFEIRTTLLPWKDLDERRLAHLASGHEDFGMAWPNAGAVRRLAELILKGETPEHSKLQAGLWQARVALSARAMDAVRQIRHFPAPCAGNGPYPPKCCLLGSLEQMGPSALGESDHFWATVSGTEIGGVRIRPRERLSAVALVKRFAEPVFLSTELGKRRQPLPDTATLAAALWLKEAEITPSDHPGWSGQWLHWKRRDQKEDEEKPVPESLWKEVQEKRRSFNLGWPPAYYAVLMLDGDRMGDWLQGKLAPKLGDTYHPKFAEYLSSLPGGSQLLEAKRPVSPTLHAAISEALTNFAVKVAPKIVREHLSELIYAGGDDLLVLLPTPTALNCAWKLRQAFRGDNDANEGAPEGFFRLGDVDLLMMGPGATLSAGLVVAHYKEDLRLVLDAARAAERAAKEGGRDALQIRVMRHSGEHSATLCAWDDLDMLCRWTKAFLAGASDRWAYKLRSLEPTLAGLPAEAIEAEIQRQFRRTDPSSQAQLGGEARLLTDLRRYTERRGKKDGLSVGQEKGKYLADFVSLIQTASFLARGRDE